jgi:hypothetical protein
MSPPVTRRIAKEFSQPGINGAVVQSYPASGKIQPMNLAGQAMNEFVLKKGSARKIMRKMTVAVAAVRLRLWLCVWLCLRHLLSRSR